MDNFPGAEYAGINITRAMIKSKELIVAIPAGATPEQLAELDRIASWARETYKIAVNYVIVH